MPNTEPRMTQKPRRWRPKSRSAFETRLFDAMVLSAVIDSCLTGKIRRSITSPSAITESLETCTLQPSWDWTVLSTGTVPHGSTPRACLQPYLTCGRVEIPVVSYRELHGRAELRGRHERALHHFRI